MVAHVNGHWLLADEVGFAVVALVVALVVSFVVALVVVLVVVLGEQ